MTKQIRHIRRSKRGKRFVAGRRVKFVNRFERIKGVTKAVYIPSRLHLTIFYKEGLNENDIKRRVLSELWNSNLERSVETMSFYGE